jgi:hypothetical protein
LGSLGRKINQYTEKNSIQWSLKIV